MKQTEGRVLAGIDIGTLTCRLLVANVSGDGVLTELQAERKVLRLGEGFAHSHRLGQVAMSRVIETLRGWRQVIEGLRKSDDKLTRQIVESFLGYRALVNGYMPYADNGIMNARAAAL